METGREVRPWDGIVASVDIQNVAEPDCARKIDALVDAGASHITLPSAWRDRFGSFATEEAVDFETATQEIAAGIVCGPARIQVEGFRVIHGEVLFVEMTPVDGECEPLLGYIALEQCGAGRGSDRSPAVAGAAYGLEAIGPNPVAVCI